MKKLMNKIMGVVLCMACIITIGMGFGIESHAADKSIIANVDGTVQSGTTYDLLKLSSGGSNYLIKIDSETDTSDCKILLPGSKVTVAIYYGNDSYLHAAKITTTSVKNVATGSTQTATVNGNVKDKTTTDTIYLDTLFGEMTIKIDKDTDFNGCSVFCIGKNVDIVVYRGSDSYLHASKISDGANSSIGSVVTNTSGTVYTTTGTVGNGSTEGMVYLNTDAGVMQIKLDANTNCSAGRVIIPGLKVTVGYYRGSDAYIHAASISATRTNAAATLSGTKYTVTGTVGSKTNENVLVLKTSSGDMQIKLDSTTAYNNIMVLTDGRSISVECQRGSDAYLHATAITAK